jgi:protein tyrosine phosphatase (PTP) superfamily phosphohydrolase (DUF442 family)
MRTPFLLSALVSTCPLASIPNALEVQRGTFVLVGLPTAETMEAMKALRVTYVICLCRETEPGVDLIAEAQQLSDRGISFSRVALDKAPSAADFDLFRQLRAALPSEARVLVHCRDGNRAAAVTVAWLVKEGRVKGPEALALARKAGMFRPETEKAFGSYLGLAL